jgi:hypothetical protein
LGASILKAGLRLWNAEMENPAAVIKIVRHNLFRPTSLIHEAGHQVAHITGWTEQLASLIEGELAAESMEMAAAWGGWASEIAADIFAFAHTGYASVAALHDILAGKPSFVFNYIPGDPHPICYIRVLLETQMCTHFYGSNGPWNELEYSWKRTYPMASAPDAIRGLLERSIPIMAKIVNISFHKPMRAFNGKSLVEMVDPRQVGPPALADLERSAGGALYTSRHWLSTECLRITALCGYLAATKPARCQEFMKQQEDWMLRLGAALQAV